MYLEMASEEDKKNAENWKADADGILIFVRLYLPILCFLIHADSLIIDRFILRCCRVVDLGVDSGHSTEPTGHIQLLPCQYLWGYFRPKSVQYLKFPPIFPTHILPTHLCRLGECPLVLEPGHQSYLCSTRNVATAVPEDISRLLSRVTAHTSEHGSVRSLLEASTSFSFLGQLKYCPRCYMFPYSCFLLA